MSKGGLYVSMTKSARIEGQRSTKEKMRRRKARQVEEH